MARRRLTWTLAAGVALAAALVLSACGGDDGTGGAGLAARTATAGSVEVTITPIRLDANGAAFTVAFDTHSGALDLDVAAHARLTVAGTDWGDPTWTGGGPGGHHRAGTLRFAAAGAARGAARLAIDGLDQPVAATWSLPT